MSGENSSGLFRLTRLRDFERIAYAWIHYQLIWLEAGVGGVVAFGEKRTSTDSHWKKLLPGDSTKGQ